MQTLTSTIVKAVGKQLAVGINCGDIAIAVEQAGFIDGVGLKARLKAFSRDCVQHGDMTPGAARMLDKIADELDAAWTGVNPT